MTVEQKRQQMNDPNTYTRLRERLEEIVVQVRSKDVPLEKSLDLYEEALRLGSRCAEMIDRTDFSSEELEAIADDAAVLLDNTSDERETDSNQSPENDSDYACDNDASESDNYSTEGIAESR